MSTDDTTKIYMLVRVTTDYPIKPTVVTKYWPSGADFSSELSHAISKLDFAQINYDVLSLFAGVPRSSSASIKVLDCGTEGTDLRRNLRRDVAAEVNKRLGKQDWSCAEMHCDTGESKEMSDTSARMVVREHVYMEIAGSRYVWWEIVRLDVVGWN